MVSSDYKLDNITTHLVELSWEYNKKDFENYSKKSSWEFGSFQTIITAAFRCRTRTDYNSFVQYQQQPFESGVYFWHL